MKYTVSKQTNKKVEEDMKFICEEIIRRIPDVLSIILTGSFARGEGPVKIKNKKFYPYNDYDIQIISKNKLKKERTDVIATEISKKLGHGGIKDLFYPFLKENQKLNQSFYIDLKCYTPTELKTLLPRIRTYELRNNSRILYGEDLRHIIPDYNLKKIPLSESAKLLLDRMSQMIEYYSTNKNYDKEILTYFIQQAYAACCTALLQLSGKYEIGYTKSMGILKQTYKKDFLELYKKIPNLHKKIEQFIEWKTDPKELPNSDVEEEWFIAKENILKVSLYFFSRFLDKNIFNEQQLAYAIRNMSKKFYTPYLKSIIYSKTHSKFITKILTPFALFILPYELKRRYNKRLKDLNIVFKTKQKSPDLIIFSSLIYLISSINKNQTNQEYSNKAQERLREVYPSQGRNWEELSIDYANAYISFFMQEL